MWWCDCFHFQTWALRDKNCSLTWAKKMPQGREEWNYTRPAGAHLYWLGLPRNATLSQTQPACRWGEKWSASSCVITNKRWALEPNPPASQGVHWHVQGDSHIWMLVTWRALIQLIVKETISVFWLFSSWEKILAVKLDYLFLWHEDCVALVWFVTDKNCYF